MSPASLLTTGQQTRMHPVSLEHGLPDISCTHLASGRLEGLVVRRCLRQLAVRRTQVVDLLLLRSASILQGTVMREKMGRFRQELAEKASISLARMVGCTQLTSTTCAALRVESTTRPVLGHEVIYPNRDDMQGIHLREKITFIHLYMLSRARQAKREL